ncbi:MAG: response regulator [Anaerolineae bacterium]|nr:response regulator [Anaerolineae bacterium]
MSNLPSVLIIEDSMTQAKRIAAQISRYDINVICAEDGLQGLRMVDIEPPNLIVLDINMPKMDGYQVCRRLKRDPNTQHIPIIMLTSNDSSEDALKGLEAGADDYIPKDAFASEHLLSVLGTMGLLGEAHVDQ